jgi:cell wall-associated NlpC family hydrolase
MIRIKFLVVFACTAGLLMSCGVAERTLKPPSATSGTSPEPLPSAISVSKYDEVQVSLEQAHRAWQGTPYVFGGSSSRGIDCSAFMQVLFDDYFGVDLPRNTKRQLYAGTSIRRELLTTGDLVFFKMGRKTLHVGVIVEGDEFLHASTSQGVTTSSLDDYYWKSRYLGGRRVMQLQ